MNEFVFNLQQFLHLLIILIPIAAIGVWRWMTWTVKQIISDIYHDPVASDRVADWKVGTALTVKGEPPRTFRKLLRSCLCERIDQICVVFDADESKNIALYEAFAKRYAGQIDARYEITRAKGKRAGLAQAIAMCDGTHLTLLMDSDTILGTGVKQAVLEAFAEERVGGVSVAQRVYKPRNWVQKQFDLMLTLRYEQEIAGQAVGGRISCLSGRCSAYLTEPLKEVAPGLLDEVWAGIRKTGGGDDKFLTTRIHDLGYRTILVRDVFVYTRAEESFKTFLKQRLRWTRNSWFSDLRALFTRRWMWSSPILLFYTLDRMLSSFTILLAPLFFIYAVLTGNLSIMMALMIWWAVSRTVKASGYLLRTGYFEIVPVYIITSFIVGFLKIHALITLGERSWMTRGSNRQSLMAHASWAITAIVCIGIGFVAWWLAHMQGF
jgi:hyaluronan synthase